MLYGMCRFYTPPTETLGVFGMTLADLQQVEGVGGNEELVGGLVRPDEPRLLGKTDENLLNDFHSVPMPICTKSLRQYVAGNGYWFSDVGSWRRVDTGISRDFYREIAYKTVSGSKNSNIYH